MLEFLAVLICVLYLCEYFRIEVKERDLEKLTEEFRVLKEKNHKLRYRV